MCLELVKPALLLYPLLELAEKRGDHVEVVLIDLVLLVLGGKIAELVPVDFLPTLAALAEATSYRLHAPRSPSACAAQSVCPWGHPGRHRAACSVRASRRGCSSFHFQARLGLPRAGRTPSPRRLLVWHSRGRARPC